MSTRPAATVLPEYVRCLSGLTPEQVPAPVVAVINMVLAANPGLEYLGWILSDERHGDVDGPGEYCLGLEGSYDWPYRTMDKFHADEVRTPGVHVWPGSGWWLGICVEDRDAAEKAADSAARWEDTDTEPEPVHTLDFTARERHLILSALTEYATNAAGHVFTEYAALVERVATAPVAAPEDPAPWNDDDDEPGMLADRDAFARALNATRADLDALRDEIAARLDRPDPRDVIVCTRR